MSRTVLELVFPAAVFLLVCTLVVLFLTATGLTRGPEIAQTEAVQVADSTATDSAQVTFASQPALTPEDFAAVAAGDALFKGNCAQCHAIDDVVVGPALAGIEQRRSMPWLLKWVRNSSKVVASGDEYAVKIFNQYQKQQMPSFTLSDEEVASIFKYIRYNEGAGTQMAGAGNTIAVVN